MHCTRLARGVVAVVQSIVSILLGIWLLPLPLEGTVRRWELSTGIGMSLAWPRGFSDNFSKVRTIIRGPLIIRYSIVIYLKPLYTVLYLWTRATAFRTTRQAGQIAQNLAQFSAVTYP